MFHVANILCKNLDIAAAGTQYSNVLDTGGAKLGDVEPIILVVKSGAACAGAGSLAMTLQSSVDEAFTAPIDELVLPSKVAAGLAKGMVFEGALPSGVKRFLRLKLVTTTGFSAGTALVTAALRNRG